MTDERGGRYFREARFFLAGDKVAAQSHILEARSLMGYMRDMQAMGGPPIQVQYATLQDGTQIKATMMNGQYQAQIVSPIRTKKKEGGILRGFVLVLDGIDLSEAARAAWTGAWDKATLFGEKDGALSVLEFAHHVTDTTPRHLEYFVAPTRTTGEAVESAGFDDVFTRLGNRVFRNASEICSTLPIENGIPYVHPNTLDTVAQLFSITDPEVKAHAANTGALLNSYTFWSFYQPLAPGYTYTAGVGLEGNKLSYVGTNVTTPGAVQVWSASVDMLSAAPWLTVTEEFQQQGVSGVLRSDTGWVASTTPAGSPPLVGPSDMRLCDVWDGQEDQWFFTGYIDSGAPKVISGVSDTYTYNKVLGDSATISLADGGEIVSTRSVAIQNTLRVDAGVVVAGTWPFAEPLIQTIFYDSDARYIARELSISFVNLYQGDAVAALSVQTVDNVEHMDVATTQSAISGTPHPIQATTSTTTQSATYGVAVDKVVSPTDELGPLNLGGGADPPYVRVRASGRVDGAGANIDTFAVSYSSSATARDYLYSDVAEEVFVWAEGTVVSSGQATAFGDTISGSHTVVVDVVVSIRGAEHRFPLFTKSIPTFAGHARYVPDDVNFGTLPGSMYWSYASPALPKPVYAPMWCAQGLCPHIAYTTKAEEDAGVAPHFALSMRVQGYLEKRSLFGSDPEPPTPPIGTVQIRMPNIEQVFAEWGVQTRTVFLGEYVAPEEPWEGGIEQKCVSIDFAIPGESHSWIEDLGAPVTSLGTTDLVGDDSFADPARSYYPDRYNGQIYRT
jgi:hypothetical protein